MSTTSKTAGNRKKGKVPENEFMKMVPKISSEETFAVSGKTFTKMYGADAYPSDLAKRARQAMEAITDEEDAAITAAARADPDSQPNRKFTKRLGRPKSAVTKQPVMLRLDPDVVQHFKAEGDGWQTRMNDALRKAAKLG